MVVVVVVVLVVEVVAAQVGMCGGVVGQVRAIAFLTRDHFLFNTTFPI